MANAESIKQELISQISVLTDATVLAQLARILNQNAPKTDAALTKLTKPRRKTLDIEQLKKEQNFTEFNRPRFDQLIKELDIQEPIEQLLKMI